LLDVLGIPKTDALGFSMGGWVALKFAVDHPERVRRLVLVDSAGLKFSTPITAESYTPIQRELPQAKLIGLEGCNHLVFWECRDRALAEALSFLR
jgi:pimeloyl-ACP methyl ester carboxylesterase